MSTRSKGKRKRSGAQRRADKARNRARRIRNGNVALIIERQEKRKEVKQALENYQEKLKQKITWI